MSFNRLNYDTCSYQHSLAESVGPGEYMLTEPPNVNEPCFAQSPQIRLQRQGVSVAQNMPLIDVDSELMNIRSYTSDFEKMEVSKDKLIQKKVLNLGIYFFLDKNTQNLLIYKLIQSMVKYFLTWDLMELEFQEYLQL